MKSTPSILIVTPSFNSVQTINDTIFSLISQGGNFDLHYHVQDGGSDDGTVDLLERWDELIRSGAFPSGARSFSFSYASVPDQGMYDAINRGFNCLPTADIMSWINADDRLQPGAVQTAASVFALASDVMWLGGRHSYCDESGMSIATLDIRTYSRDLLALGYYEGRKLFFMQQEGVFWRRTLWEHIGKKLDDRLRFAGDFDLWRRFAEYADYVSIDAVLANFRIRDGQATSSLNDYYAEVDGSLITIRDRRESIWRSLTAGEKVDDCFDMSGRVAFYDGEKRSWVLRRSQASVPFPTGGTSVHRAKRFIKRILNRLV